MTDITDRDRRDAYRFAEAVARPVRGVPRTEDMEAAARVILATVDAPATLAEDLAHIAEHWEEWATDTIAEALTAATTRAEQLEHDLTEARAEVERLTAEVETEKRLRSPIPGATNLVNILPTATVAPEEKVAPDQKPNSLKTPNSSFKSSLKEPAQNPADVKPGEAWTVEVRGVQTVAVRPDGKGLRQWVMAEFINGTCWCSDSNITLIRRLVPAPRVITDPDELDGLPDWSIVKTDELDKLGDESLAKSDAHRWLYAQHDLWQGKHRAYTSTAVIEHFGPVTVLWEAGK